MRDITVVRLMDKRQQNCPERLVTGEVYRGMCQGHSRAKSFLGMALKEEREVVGRRRWEGTYE